MPFDPVKEKELEGNLRNCWRDLSDIARDDIMATLRSDEHIGVNSWVQSIYDGNQIGCLMMDGHTADYTPWKNKITEQNEEVGYEDDLQDAEESSFLEEVYKCDSGSVDAMAGAFDHWASAVSIISGAVETTPRMKTLRWTTVQKMYGGEDYKYEQTAQVLAKAARKKLIRILEDTEL
jgi:hypothetical protein